MRRLILVIPALLWTWLALAAASMPNASADEPAATQKKPAEKKVQKSGAKASGKDLLKQWADLLARRERVLKAATRIEDDVNSAKTFEEKRKVQATLEKLQTEFQEINPGLEQLAPAVHRQDPTDPIAAQILVSKLLPKEEDEAVPDENYAEILSIIQGLTRNDKDSQSTIENILFILLQNWRQSEAGPFLDKLAEAKGVSSPILTLDAMAHLYLSEFDKAAELALRAAHAGAVAPNIVDFHKTCADYVGYWKREQQLRAAEAKADDLPRVLFKTNKGDIVIELFENEAPNTVANFISLVAAKKYDGVKFHRVIPGFMAQGGDPNTLDDDPRNDGQGGPGYAIACESYNDKARMHFQGSLSMAHSGKKDSGGSQFFLTHAPTAHLNWAQGKRGSSHTVFGRVIKGLDVALALRKGDKIESAQVVRQRDHAYVPVKVGDKPAGGNRTK